MLNNETLPHLYLHHIVALRGFLAAYLGCRETAGELAHESFLRLMTRPDSEALNHQRRGVGKQMMQAMQERYAGFHQQMLAADGNAIDFYKSLGFSRAGKTDLMWIYAGSEH